MGRLRIISQGRQTPCDLHCILHNSDIGVPQRCCRATNYSPIHNLALSQNGDEVRILIKGELDEIERWSAYSEVSAHHATPTSNRLPAASGHRAARVVGKLSRGRMLLCKLQGFGTALGRLCALTSHQPWPEPSNSARVGSGPRLTSSRLFVRACRCLME